MKKYLMKGFAAIVFCGAIASCSHDMDSGSDAVQTSVVEKYEKAFVTRFGEPASTQTWGFGSGKAMTRSQYEPSVQHLNAPYDTEWITNYLSTAKEPNDQNISYNNNNRQWVDAVESVWVPGVESQWVVTQEGTVTTEPKLPNFGWADDPVGMIWYNWGSPSNDDRDFLNNQLQPKIDEYNNMTLVNKWDNNPAQWIATYNAKIDKWYEIRQFLTENNRLNWMNVWDQPVYGVIGDEEGYWTEATEGYWTEATEGHWVEDENYVTHFKIEGSYSKTIPVVASEGHSLTWNDTKKINELGEANGAARTVVVTGTWNINEEQRVGSGGKIIVANGGKINVGTNGQLNFVNQAQLVVLSGGEISGNGLVQVTNGNADGEGSYNAGTINIAKFNNNFGKFYNYGTFKANIYAAGAAESNFYNHGIVNIQGTQEYNNEGQPYYVSSNARVFNACQWYCSGNMRVRNYEGIMGSSFIINGELMCSSSADGTSDPTYVGLAAGALVKCGTLYNNGTNWTGPTEGGYAALEITDRITFLNWEQNAPETGGYFENNIYVKSANWNNVPDGNGYHQTDTSDEYNHSISIAEYKFFNIVANCTSGGTGNVKKVNNGDQELLPATSAEEGGFELGVKGCTPGFKGDVTTVTPPPVIIVDEADEIVVLAEDLTIDDVRPDFDFNDVVFKVSRYTSGDKTGQVWVTLLAAGGTLHLTVDGHEVHEEFAKTNPDKVIVTTTMINTAENGHEAYNTASFQVTNPSGSTIQEIANNIPVVVTKFGEQIPLVAPTGGVPSKIAVKTDFLTDEDMGWCDERQDIDEKYNVKGTALFKSYVRGELDDNWYTLIKTKGN
jgi:hypothetical protein